METKVCPVCGEEVKGDKEHKYLCKQCGVLFKESQVVDKIVNGQQSILFFPSRITFPKLSTV